MVVAGCGGWGMSENIGHHCWPATKNKKKHWLKRPKAVPLQNSTISLTTIYSLTRSSQHHQSFFLIADFLAESLKAKQKLAKKITHFTIQFCSKNLTHFTNLNLLDIENNILLQHSQKPFSLYKFSSKHFSGCCQKKHLHCTISRRQELYSQSTLKAVYFCISPSENFCSRDVVRFYLVGEREAE